jgi:hypothetical protein
MLSSVSSGLKNVQLKLRKNKNNACEISDDHADGNSRLNGQSEFRHGVAPSEGGVG